MYLRGDQKDGVGDRQNVDEDDRELADDEVEEEEEDEVPDGMSNSGVIVLEGVASNLGDFL